MNSETKFKFLCNECYELLDYINESRLEIVDYSIYLDASGDLNFVQKDITSYEVLSSACPKCDKDIKSPESIVVRVTYYDNGNLVITPEGDFWKNVFKSVSIHKEELDKLPSKIKRIYVRKE